MDQFYCKTSNGVRPPTFKHSDVQAAVKEAKRLSDEHHCSVEILKVIGTVEWKDIPVVEKKQILTMIPGYGITDDLPF